MQTKNGKQPDEKFPLKLTVKQRESMMQATRLTMGLKTRIKKASKDQQFVEFTKKELEKMGDEIDASLVYVPPAHRKQLNVVLNKIGDLLAYLVVKHIVQKGQAVDKAGVIYQFKVTLKESHPRIWRRIQVPDCTLGELHEVLQVVMGWEDCHLHQFVVNGKHFGEATHDDLDMEIEDEDGIRSARSYDGQEHSPDRLRVRLRRLLAARDRPGENPGTRAEVKYPRCVEGARACPPEDVGGIWGYAEFLEAISDPSHEDHADMVDWIGGKFDPEKFSVDEVNKELRKG